MTTIIDKLFLGDATDAGSLDLIQKEGITHIVNCAREVPCHFPGTFSYLKLSTPDDSPAFRKEVAKACAFIRAGIARGGTLVHCSAGVTRSAGMVLAYLCHRGTEPVEACRFLSARVKTQPDAQFLQLLEKWYSKGIADRAAAP